jgi:glycosyltransferase involved in cell wall biosynthesis
VGAVIANYNHAKFLDVAISSLLKNKFLSEITVVDDASTDESIKIIEKYTNVNLLRNSHQKGASYSLDLGIRTLNTDFVILQGSDDISNPDRIETQLSTIIEKNCSVVVGRNEFIDDNGEKLAKNDLFKHGSHENLFESLFLKGNSICAPAVMLKREHYLKKGGFRHNLHQLQDYFLWLQFAFENEIRFHDDVVVQYRLHKKNLSRECSEETRNKISLGNKGKKCSEETKKKMSDARKGKKLPESTIEKMRNKKLTPEHREKIRISWIERKRKKELQKTDETYKISNA